MDSFEVIDMARPMTLNGYVVRNLSEMPSDPLHDAAMKSPQESLNPAFLRCLDLVDKASICVLSGPFLTWIKSSSSWAGESLANLQSVSGTTDGERLLTTWLSIDRFSAVLAAGSGVSGLDNISALTAGWHSLALDEVHFDFYAIG
jgi:hypothetical protein